MCRSVIGEHASIGDELDDHDHDGVYNEEHDDDDHDGIIDDDDKTYQSIWAAV